MPIDPLTPILLATGNPHKVSELRAIFAKFNIRTPLIGLADLPNAASLQEPKELGLGATFDDNAAIKARSYAQQSGHRCLADDSGIEIDALTPAGSPARPGVISSHYCTDGKETDPPMSRQERDQKNNERVLRELAGIPTEQRTARFICSMAYAPAPITGETAPQPLVVSQGAMEGRIGTPPRVPSGKNGFGYDPLFLVAPVSKYMPNPYAQTAAEMDPETKNSRSHRSRAANIMIDELIRAGLIA